MSVARVFGSDNNRYRAGRAVVGNVARGERVSGESVGRAGGAARGHAPRARVCVYVYLLSRVRVRFSQTRRTDGRNEQAALVDGSGGVCDYRGIRSPYIRIYTAAAEAAAAAATTTLYAGAGGGEVMDPSVLSAMDRDALKKQIENMRYQSTMDRWPLSRSIQA